MHSVLPDVAAFPDDAAFGGVPSTVSGGDVAFLEPSFVLTESAVEFYDLSDAEVDAAAGVGLRETGFHPIVAPALPEGTGASDAGLESDDTRRPQGLAGSLAALRESNAYAAVRARGWQIAACVAIGIAAIGIPAAYSAGWNAAVDNAKLTAEQAPGSGDAEGLQEHADGAAAVIDRVSTEEMVAITVYPAAEEPAEELARLAPVDVSAGTSRILDVPVVNQLDDSNGGRSLWAGCEVASLAMILKYAGVDVTKEALQDAIPTVPLVDDNGLYGNPNFAFVGQMDGDWYGMGYSVYHAPIADLARSFVQDRPLKVVDLSGQSFTTLLKEIASGNPCWVITTTSMTPEMLEEYWETPDGGVTVNWALHSVALTGYDDASVFINDPYGYDPNVAYNRDDFERAWKMMGSQAVAIVPAE